MVTIVNKKTLKSYEVSEQKAEEIKNSESGSRFIFPVIEKINLPELNKINNVSEETSETKPENIVKDISEKVEGTEPNETKTEKPKRAKANSAKVD